MRHRRQFIWLLMLILWVWPGKGRGQLLQFSNETFTPLRVNPAWGSLKPLTEGGFQYRYNASAAQLGFHTARLSGNYPFVIKRGLPIFAISASALMDREMSVGAFRRQEYTLAGSVSVPIGPGTLFGVGVQGHFHQEDVLWNGLTTGSQYLAPLGYNPNLATGENFENLVNEYGSLSVGLGMSSYGEGMLTPRHFLGVALYDVNRPRLNFLDDQRRPWVLVTQAAMTILEKDKLSIRPDFRYQMNGAYQSTVVGVGFGYNMGTVRDPSEIWLKARYRFQEAGILAVEVRKSNLVFGYAYDVDVASSGSGLHHTGAHEIALQINGPADNWWWSRLRPPSRSRTPEVKEGTRDPNKWTFPWPEIDWPKINWPRLNIRWPKWLRKKRPPSSSTRRRRPPRETDTSTPNDSIPADSIGDPNGGGRVEIGLITGDPELPSDTVILENLVKHFYFETNEAELDTSATQYLDSLLVSLLDNEDWLIDVTGHCDDVGDEEENLRLSRERALSVGFYLAEEGVARRRIRIKGKGEMEPIDTNETVEGRANNRRVEITIYKVPPQ